MNEYSVCNISRLRMGIDGEGIRTLILTAGCPLRCAYCINSFSWDGTGRIKHMTAKEIYDKICIDRPYILATRGGITIGGGEPLLQPNLFKEIRCFMEPEMTLYAETSFNVPYESIQFIEKYTEHFYVDIKTTDENIYYDYTKGKLQIALNNIKQFIGDYGSEKITVRIPYIPDYTNPVKQIESKKLLEDIGVKKFDLFRYKV